MVFTWRPSGHVRAQNNRGKVFEFETVIMQSMSHDLLLPLCTNMAVTWLKTIYFYLQRHKTFYALNNSNLNTLYVKGSTIYNLRKLRVWINRPHTELGKSSLRHWAALIWNILPEHIKSCHDLSTFKKEIKNLKGYLMTLSSVKGSLIVSNRNREFNYFLNINRIST